MARKRKGASVTFEPQLIEVPIFTCAELLAYENEIDAAMVALDKVKARSRTFRRHIDGAVDKWGPPEREPTPPAPPSLKVVPDDDEPPPF